MKVVVTDKATGKTTEYPYPSKAAKDEIQAGADFNGLEYDVALKVLKAGEAIETFGYIRKLVS